jgi:hypothetical protein
MQSQPQTQGGARMAQKKCWEFKKCDKEKECPAYPHKGTVCFSVKSTLCRGEIQGDYSDKIQACRETCDFYKYLVSDPAPAS